MKPTLVIVLLVLSLGANAYLWLRVDRLEKAALGEKAEAPVDYPLGENMGYMQRYADKLWYAGAAGNWALAKFYQGEIVETADDIMHANVTKEGVEVSKLMTATLPPVLQPLGQAIDAHDAAQFRDRYTAMVASCNACHGSARHAFIQVAIPSGQPTFWNQKFTP